MRSLRFLIASSLALAAACATSHTSNQTGVCAPGQQVECACVGGAMGAQACLDDGSGYGACDCGSSTSSSTTSTSSGSGGHGGMSGSSGTESSTSTTTMESSATSTTVTTSATSTSSSTSTASASSSSATSTSSSTSTGAGGANGCVSAPQPGLQAWYTLDETMSPICDHSGNGNDGIMEGAGYVLGAPGKYGTAIAFNGTDGRVHIPASPTLDFSTAATLELWVNINAGNGVYSTVSRGTGNGDNNVMMNSSCGNMQTIFQYIPNTTNVTSACGQIPSGVWTHIAVTNDNVTLTLYINGAFNTTAPGGNMGPLLSDLYIGRREQGIFAMDGAIDDVKWWNVVRTQAEICGDAGGAWNGNACSIP